MKELGVDHTNEGLFLYQQKYTRDMLQKFSMLDKQALTPMETNVKICSYEDKELNDETTYRQRVDSLIYLTLTRPDISYAVGVMSR